MTKYKVVLDTNVYLSGIIFGGNSRHILDLAIEGKIAAVASPAILLEIAEKLKNKFYWNKEQIIVTIKSIAKLSEVVTPKKKLQIVMKDKDDNKIIEAADEANVDFIITGDKHLLEIKKYLDIRIISPSQFLSVYFTRT